MPLYITLNDLKIRLVGKVAFDDTGADPNKMSADLANALIDQAEGDVELDLSLRYAVPFQGVNGEAYSTLPLRPTQNVIRTLCTNKAILYLLGTDFGRGSITDGEEYAKLLLAQYRDLLKRLVGEADEGMARQWKLPPLPGLRLGAHNAASDDGFLGQIYKSGSGQGDYAATHINDPSQSFFNVEVGDCDPVTDFQP